LPLLLAVYVRMAHEFLISEYISIWKISRLLDYKMYSCATEFFIFFIFLYFYIMLHYRWPAAVFYPFYTPHRTSMDVCSHLCSCFCLFDVFCCFCFPRSIFCCVIYYYFFIGLYLVCLPSLDKLTWQVFRLTHFLTRHVFSVTRKVIPSPEGFSHITFIRRRSWLAYHRRNGKTPIKWERRYEAWFVLIKRTVLIWLWYQ
jgi:hypothetical protein